MDNAHGIDLAERARSKHGKRLTQAEIALILQLHAAGKTGVEIARIVGCGNSTVSRTLEQFADVRELARKRLEGGALKLAAAVVNTTDAAVALKTLGKLDVVREDRASDTNVAVLMGTPDHPLEPPAITVAALSPRRETITPVSPAPEIAVSVDSGEAKAPPIAPFRPDDVA